MINLIFPKTCYSCDLEGEYLCAKCFNKLIKVDPINRCHYCNKECRMGFLHSECREYTYIDGVLNLTVYDGLIKKLIYEIKYNYYFGVVESLGKIMADYLKFYNFEGENSIFSFVPTSKKKLRIRGFNQSEYLAKSVAKNSGISLVKVLEKTKNTGAQAKLDKSGRAENLKGAFHEVNNLAQIEANIRNIIIVDDVFTTGATLNECAKVIKKFLPDVKVFGYVIAKARG